MDIHGQNIFFIKSGQIYMKDAECAVSEKKQISDFCFSSYGHFCT